MRKNELLRRDFVIYVFNDFATKKKILRMNHDDFDANHFARVRIENAIRRKYYWSNMIDDIVEYVRNCSNCQRVRVHHHKSYEDLTLISLDDVDSFHTMIMNFIIDMSFARDSYIEKINDAILVLINKLIKYATYIATIKDLNVERLADLMWREFICRHDMMRSIISNRDSLFTSHFWSTLCWHLRAKRKLSTAFHSQTNDQTKRQNQVLKHYLRVYCNYKQNNWSKLLLMTSFAYNNSIHSVTKKTSNELLIEYTASFASASENRTLRKKTSLTIERAKWLQDIKDYLKELWERVSKQQTKYYNAHHKSISFMINDKVLLRSLNIRTLRSKKKIDHKQLKSFEVVKRIKSQAYLLDLFERYDSIHFVFHVFLLESWYSRDENSKSQFILVEDEEKWEIEKILNKRIKKSKFEYLIQWVDSSSYENSWESMKYLENARKAIQNYENESKKHRSAARMSKR